MYFLAATAREWDWLLGELVSLCVPGGVPNPTDVLAFLSQSGELLPGLFIG